MLVIIGALAAALAPPPTPGRFQLALLQLSVGSNKTQNLLSAQAAVREAVGRGAQLVVLPECFNSPYAVKAFPEYAEEVPMAGASDPSTQPSTHMLRSLAKELEIFIVGGSIPERDASNGKLYNTAIAVGPDGAILVRHRKIHLFDVNVPGKITFRESDTLSAPSPTTRPIFDTPWGRVGLGICYDLRFPQYAALLREAGAHILVFPGAFNLFSGPLHWELLARARAVDTQSFVAVVSPSRSEDSSAYQAYGHTSLVSPWGKLVATTEHAPAAVHAEVDVAETSEPRAAIPVFDQKRDDLYTLEWTGGGVRGGGGGPRAWWRRLAAWVRGRRAGR